MRKDELNGGGIEKGFVTRRLLTRLYTGLQLGSSALLPTFPPLLGRADFAAPHR